MSAMMLLHRALLAARSSRRVVVATTLPTCSSFGNNNPLLLRNTISSKRFNSTTAIVDGEEQPLEFTDPLNRGRIICVTSGKGGVGKTTIAASFGLGLATRGYKTCVVDFDIGLRNLDLHLGMERRVIFDMVHVLLDECSLHQAVLKYKKEPNLSLLAASQTRDKDSLTVEGVETILRDLSDTFDYVVLDSPAGIESGAKHAMYFCDHAVIVTNPEISSCRDADKMIGFISCKSKRAELQNNANTCKPVDIQLLINRYDPQRAQKEESLAMEDLTDLLGLKLVGLIPESKEVLTATNLGTPVISMSPDSIPAAMAFEDMVDRFLGEERELRFTKPENVSFLQKLFGQG